MYEQQLVQYLTYIPNCLGVILNITELFLASNPLAYAVKILLYIVYY